MMISRKAMEITLNVVIIAAIALIVMIILIILLGGQMGKTRISLNKSRETYSQDRCEIPGSGRVCVNTATECLSQGGIPMGQMDCGTNTEYVEPAAGASGPPKEVKTNRVCCSK